MSRDCWMGRGAVDGGVGAGREGINKNENVSLIR